jgi:hypothetical protein
MSRLVTMALMAVLAAAATGRACAQTYVERAPATAEQVAAARAEADRLIAAGKAEDVFVDESTGVLAQVRHLKSGLVCQFLPGAPKNAVTVYASGGVPRGDDVGCGHTVKDIVLTIFVTRYPPPKTVADVLRESLADIPRNFADLKPYTGQYASVTPDRAGAPLAAVQARDRTVIRLTGMFQGRAVFTRTAAAACDPWIVAQRVTAPVDQALAADVAAELDLNGALASVCKADPPTG